MTTLNEADVEQAALDWLEESGWRVTHGREIASGLSGAAAARHHSTEAYFGRGAGGGDSKRDRT